MKLPGDEWVNADGRYRFSTRSVCADRSGRCAVCCGHGRGNDDGGAISQVTVLSPVMAWILGVRLKHVQHDDLCAPITDWWPKLQEVRTL